MSRLLSFKGQYANKGSAIKANLLLIYFVDNDGNHIIYSPHLDLSGYGKSEIEAKHSFEDAFEELLDYTIKKKTLGKLLQQLGWEVKGSIKHPRKIVMPKLKNVLENQYISEIFDKYETKTFHQPVQLPAFA